MILQYSGDPTLNWVSKIIAYTYFQQHFRQCTYHCMCYLYFNSSYFISLSSVCADKKKMLPCRSGCQLTGHDGGHQISIVHSTIYPRRKRMDC